MDEAGHKDVFVLTFRLISDKSSAGITCRLEIRSDFGNDLDGKGLWEWLDLPYATAGRRAWPS